MPKNVVSAIVFSLVSLALPAAAQYTAWSAPEKLPAPVNTAYLDSCSTISKDGLSLFFSSNRQTGNPASQDRDLYVAQRSSVNAAWQEPVRLAALSTMGYWDSCPQLSLDEHRIYFNSTRPGGCGAEDFWVSRRRDRRDDFGWETPKHLDCEADGGINTANRELTPALFEAEPGKVIMYLTRVLPGPTAVIFQSEMREDNTFGPATPVPELSLANFNSAYAVVRRDGLEVIFGSNRPGGSGVPNSLDFWTATRLRTSDPWSSPVFLLVLGSPAWMGGHSALSFDGTELYFNSWRPNGPGTTPGDIYISKREKLR